jgi:hypothetical protein
MPGLFAVALAFVVAVTRYVSPAAQSTAYVLIAVGMALGCALWVRDGHVW